MKQLFTLLACLIVTATLWAQSPAKMSYQAVIRNSSNALVTNTPVRMKISILQGSASGTAVYSEIQTPTTNANGLISIEIGGAGFDAIDWSTGPFFIMAETDPAGGTNYTISGTSQLLSVPYALHSKTAESISGDITETDPVFVASPANTISTGNIANWNTAYGWGNHATEGYLKSFTETDPVWTAASANYYTKANLQTSGGSQLHFNNLINKPTSVAGYGILDAMTTAHAAYGITSANITNWNTAFGWGNHAGLYRTISYVPAWSEITSNPFVFTSVANNQLVKYNSTSGRWENWTANFLTSFTETDPLWTAASTNYYTKTNMQTSGASQLHFNNITNKPTSVAGYGILDAMTTAHAAYGITSTNIANWNSAYGWGNHAGLYRPISYVPAWSEIISNPFVFTSVANNQLVKYNSTSGRWENWTANFLTSFTETDPKIGSNTTGYSPKWDGSALVTGAIYQDASGNVGIGTTVPINRLSITGSADISTSILTPSIQPLPGDGTTLAIKTNNAASASGGLTINTGNTTTNGTPNSSGSITIQTGNTFTNGSTTGNIVLSAGKELWTGISYGAGLVLGGYPGGNGGGSATLSGGNSWADAGSITLQAGNAGAGNGGDINLKAGNGGASVGGAGNITLNTGNDISSGPGIISMKINNTEALRINPANNVGIGTTSPSTKLDVNGVIAATGGNSTNWNTAFSWGNHASAGYLTSYTETDPKIGTNTAGYSPKWNGTTLVTGAIFQDATDNVGIGTTNPGGVLDVAGGFIRVQASDNVPTGNVNALEMGYFTTGGYAFLQGYNRGTGTFLPIEFSGSTVGFRANGTTAIQISTNGNVGIGTSSPGAKLEVNGQIKITGGASTQFLKADGSLDANTYMISVREAADEFSATASQSSFTLSQTPSSNSKVKMYINGVRISNTAYSFVGVSLTYNPTNNGSYVLTAGDRIQFDYSY
ncbi:MAG: hypothetical protein WC780_11260 [Lentimicrobiaceae bacterium]